MIVVVPFTRWENFDRLLEMWRAQTHPARIVLVTTADAARNVLHFDSEEADAEGVEIIQTRPSIGAARNAGMRRARELGEEWVVFLDDDDYHGPGLLDAFAHGIEVADHETHALSIGIRYVRLEDGIYLFDTPFRFCPGHCTAARVDAVPDFKTIPRGEDNEWSHRMGMRHARQIPEPWHFVYRPSRLSAKTDAKFRAEFGPYVRIGDVPDEYVDGAGPADDAIAWG